MSRVSRHINITVKTTPAYSPFSNGIVERHNAILAETMVKTLDDLKCEPELALSWALSAKNALLNNDGFSPNQLVFGKNFNFPSVVSNKLPALSTTTNEIIKDKLQVLHNARQNFIKSESSEKVKRAFRHKTRTFSGCTFVAGDQVVL